MTAIAMPNAAFWELAALSGLLGYLHGHQASHLVWISSGRATLNPTLLRALMVSYKYAYQWLFYLPWAFLVWYGYKTVWWYPIGAFVISVIFRLVLTAIETHTGLIKNAWAISLAGILLVPIALALMGRIVASL